MQPKSDARLLRDYVELQCEAAFGEIVARYTDMVYCAAVRQTGSPEHARDVAQSVFTDLARKAPSLAGKAKDGDSLVGWLFKSTRYAALRMRRDDRRRQWRERKAVEGFVSDAEVSADWDTVRPLLDEAISRLSAPDRDALLLRFFKNQDFRTVAAALGVSDDAAQKRVARALARLRGELTRHGVTTTLAALGSAISVHAVEGYPVGLAATLTGAALAGAAKTGTTFGILAFMTMTKLKTGVFAALLLAALVTPLAIRHQDGIQLREKDAFARSQADQIARLKAENERLSRRPAQSDSGATLGNEQQSELLRLRGEVARLREEARKEAAPPATTVAWAARIARLKQTVDRWPEKRIPEMQFLSDKDWAASMRDADLSSDDGLRQAFSELRGAAKSAFLGLTREAFKKYAAANAGPLPSDPAQLAQFLNANPDLFPVDLAQLKPYYDAPVDDRIFPRYQMVHPSRLHDNLSDILVREVAPPVDDEYDTSNEAGFYSGGVANVNRIKDAVAAASQQFAGSNGGQLPTEPAEIIPFLSQPLDAALVQKYLSKLSDNRRTP